MLAEAMRFLKLSLVIVAVLLVGTAIFIFRYARGQGRDNVDWKRFSTAQVAFDAHGIPSLRAETWEALIEAQGFVMASDRLWQMDLMRRSASGRLAEWFGENPKVLDWDEKRRREDWESTATHGVDHLPDLERAACEGFARGVNRFIQENPGRWGIEYRLLGESPQPWACRDSLLILLSMAEDLSEAIDEEAPGSLWRKNLPKPWEDFLFAQNHPWNRPIFGAPSAVRLDIPVPFRLKRQPIQSGEGGESELADEFFPGSNAWVYRGPEGIFLANDPHLSVGVPQLWYPMRLYRGEAETVTGVALPGLPGIVLGRNRSIAWGFTNAKEDIDDLLEEEVSGDGLRYVAQVSDGKKTWKPIEKRPYVIQARGGGRREGVALFTHRGPLMKRKYLGEALYSRQWLALQPGILRLPILAMMQSTDWDTFNRAVDDFSVPAQAILFADRDGGIGIRLSGRGVQRRKSGLTVQKAVEGEWRGMEPVNLRPRLYVPPGGDARYLSTANQRLWVKGYGEHWSSDMRQDRIQTALANGKVQSRAAMEKLQHDTQSRFFKELVTWIAANAAPNSPTQEKIAARWRKWDGSAEADPTAFSQAVFARGVLSGLLIGRVRKHLLPPEMKGVPYTWKLQNAWEQAVLRPESALVVFGLEPAETAAWLFAQIEKKAPAPEGYAFLNRWQAQHPFTSVPIFGRFFRVDERPQVGYEGLVRVERPTSGASTRMVWDLKSEDWGSWAFPVGQSGHFLSPHYTGFRPGWFEGKSLPVLSH